jgi:hypothetical protein
MEMLKKKELLFLMLHCCFLCGIGDPTDERLPQMGPEVSFFAEPILYSPSRFMNQTKDR